MGWLYLEVSCVDEDGGARLVRYENIEHSPVLLHFFFLLPSKKIHGFFLSTVSFRESKVIFNMIKFPIILKYIGFA